MLPQTEMIKKIVVLLTLSLTGCMSGGADAPVLRNENSSKAPTQAETTENVSQKVSISPFPYDKTAEAVEKVSQIIANNATLYTVQLDNGVPWQSAYDGKPFPKEVNEQWERHKKAIGRKAVYLAIAPLAEDRTSWAPSAAGEKTPSWAKDEKSARKELKDAYSRYVIRAMDYFHPEFLNLGVEAGDMALKKPAKWGAFEELYLETAAQVRAKYPNVKIGISFSLPLLMQSEVKDRAAKVIEGSDYCGISFYPFMTEFYKAIGGVKLAAPPNQWREPLNWLDTNITKPIAICETAYSTRQVDLPKYKIKLEGDSDRQTQYVKELAAIAKRDHYLFTVFFLTVDYVPLLRSMPAGDGSAGMWAYTGFFDEHLNEKPSWKAYQEAWLGRKVNSTAKQAEPEPGKKQITGSRSAIGFNDSGDLFKAPGSDKVTLESVDGKAKVMKWNFNYRPKEFAWSVKDVPSGSGAGAVGLDFEIKSDRDGRMMLQVEQADGGAFYTVIDPGQKWTRKRISWNQFSVDASKGYKGKLQPAQIVRLMLVDATAVDGKVSGSRTVEVANLDYIRNSQ